MGSRKRSVGFGTIVLGGDRQVELRRTAWAHGMRSGWKREAPGYRIVTVSLVRTSIPSRGGTAMNEAVPSGSRYRDTGSSLGRLAAW